LSIRLPDASAYRRNNPAALLVVTYPACKPQVIAKSRSLETVQKQDRDLSGAIDQFVSEEGLKAAELRYLPLLLPRIRHHRLVAG
jgi:hypothetical protein